MRAVFSVLLFVGVTAVVGCGKKEDEPKSGGPVQQPQPPAGSNIVKSWKLYTNEAVLFKAEFPLGDPTVRPVFFGNQPKAVVEGWDYSVDVYTKDSGQEFYLFGIRAAKFRFGAKTKPEDKAETLDIFTQGLPPHLAQQRRLVVTQSDILANGNFCNKNIIIQQLTISDQMAKVSDKLSQSQRDTARKNVGVGAQKLASNWREACVRDLTGKMANESALRCAMASKTVAAFETCLNGPAK